MNRNIANLKNAQIYNSKLFGSNFVHRTATSKYNYAKL